MSTKLSVLRTAELSKDFGEKGDRQLRNLVIKCTFAASKGCKYAVVGDGDVFTANISCSENDWNERKDDGKENFLRWFKEDFQNALNSGDVELFGFSFAVKDVTAEKWDSIYNKNTKHVIFEFRPALMSDDVEKAKRFVIRGIERGIEQKRFFRTKEEAEG